MSQPLPCLSTCPSCGGPLSASLEYWRPGLIANDAQFVRPVCGPPVKLGVIGRVTSVVKRETREWLPA